MVNGEGYFLKRGLSCDFLAKPCIIAGADHAGQLAVNGLNRKLIGAGAGVSPRWERCNRHHSTPFSL
jgi:hypothetical protein